jgi:hypothetical protein
MSRISPIYIVLVFLLLTACNSSKRLLEQGAYYQSVMAAVDKLQRSPNNRKSQNALRKAYPMAVNYFLNEISKAKKSAVDFPWSRVAESYRSLNQMYEAVNASPRARQVIRNPRSYYQEYADVRKRAAAEQYEAGEQALRRDTREDARQAYSHFQSANAFQRGYLDVENKLRQARDAATLLVVVDAVPVPSRFFKVSADFFYDQVDRHLKQLMRQNEFLAFYSKDEARRIGLNNPDQVLRLQFEDFSVGNSRAFQNKETIERDSVEVGEITLEDGTKKPVIGTVKATLITRRIEVLSNGILSMQVMDGGSNVRVFRDEIPGEFLWFAEWATFQGDERALDKVQRALCQQVEASPPNPQAMFVEFTRPIFSQLSNQLDRYYRNI